MTLTLPQRTVRTQCLQVAADHGVASASNRIHEFQENLNYKELYTQALDMLDVERIKYDVLERACRDQMIQMMGRHEDAMREVCAQRDQFDDSRKEILRKNGELGAALRGKDETISELLEVIDRVRRIASTIRMSKKARQIEAILQPIPTE